MNESEKFRIRTGRRLIGGRKLGPRPRRPSEIASKGWCQGHHAVTANDVPCSLVSPHAAKFDILGAVMLGRVRGYDVGGRVLVLRDAMPHNSNLIHWNDAPDRTVMDVVQLLREYGL